MPFTSLVVLFSALGLCREYRATEGKLKNTQEWVEMGFLKTGCPMLETVWGYDRLTDLTWLLQETNGWVHVPWEGSPIDSMPF